MKRLCYILVLATIGCGPGKEDESTGPQAVNVEDQPLKPLRPSDLFSKAVADRIMGRQTVLKDSISVTEKGVSLYKATYSTGLAENEDVVYFMYEQYEHAINAHEIYEGIRVANQQSGIEAWHDLGDEGYFHSDGKAFYFTLARKGSRMVRIKVNKLTQHTKLEAFDAGVKEIVEQL